MRRLAEQHGRKMRFGVRLYVIVRETDAEAWAAADRLMARMDDASIARVQKLAGESDSVGQQRMLALHGGKRPERARDLEIYPDMWSGMGLVRTGPGTTLIGSPQTVAARMKEYGDYGADAFILSGYPMLEEAHRVSELLLPLLPLDHCR